MRLLLNQYLFVIASASSFFFIASITNSFLYDVSRRVWTCTYQYYLYTQLHFYPSKRASLLSSVCLLETYLFSFHRYLANSNMWTRSIKIIIELKLFFLDNPKQTKYGILLKVISNILEGKWHFSFLCIWYILECNATNINHNVST